MKRCKVTGCVNPRGGHKFIWKGLCAEHAAAADRLGNPDRSRWFARRIAKLGALGVLLLGCSAPTESLAVDQAAADPDPCAKYSAFCARSDVQHVPSSGACYRVTASTVAPLANCFGDETTTATNEVRTTCGPGYIVTSFELEPGDCFYFYACGGDTFEQAAPTVEVCQ